MLKFWKKMSVKEGWKICCLSRCQSTSICIYYTSFFLPSMRNLFTVLFIHFSSNKVPCYLDKTIWNNMKGNRISLPPIFVEFKKKRNLQVRIDKSITDCKNNNQYWIHWTDNLYEKEGYTWSNYYIYCCYLWPFLQFTLCNSKTVQCSRHKQKYR